MLNVIISTRLTLSKLGANLSNRQTRQAFLGKRHINSLFPEVKLHNRRYCHQSMTCDLF